jgi:hypothetical protein
MYFYKTEEQEQELYRKYTTGMLPRTPKEKLVINPKVAYHVTEEEIKNSIPFEWIRKKKSIYGELSPLCMKDPVDNLNWDFLYFKNVDVFPI